MLKVKLSTSSSSRRTALIYFLRRTKNASVQELTMINQFESQESCPFHCLATLISVNCDTSEDLYPLIMASNGPPNYVNRMLSDEEEREYNDESGDSYFIAAAAAAAAAMKWA